MVKLARPGPPSPRHATCRQERPARAAAPGRMSARRSGKKTASGKQPYAIALAARKLMALAGLWESWRSPAGERVRRFAIITTEPNELCAALHNRMPAILAPQAWPEWLGEQPADEA